MLKRNSSLKLPVGQIEKKLKKTAEKFSIKYPRKIFVRHFARLLLRFLLRILTRLEIQGKENIPEKGPVILAGNHVSVLEAALMIAFSPRLVEMLGTGDIPLDPNYGWIANIYGFITINRGNLDREAMQKCFDVLGQKGVIGIFPEGGIWNPANMEPQTGISLLSYKANALVVPIGFGGMEGALNEAFKLKHPRVVMNIGKPLPPVVINEGESKKDGLKKAAHEILEAIDALLPVDENKSRIKRLNETFDLDIRIQNQSEPVDIPPELRVIHASALARLFYTPVLLDTLKRNLNLPISPLKDQSPIKDKTAFKTTLFSILNYLEINPGFFTYRYGIEEGLAVKDALNELSNLVSWVQDTRFDIYLNPVQKYQDAQTLQWNYRQGGDFPKSIR